MRKTLHRKNPVFLAVAVGLLAAGCGSGQSAEPAEPSAAEKTSANHELSHSGELLPPDKATDAFSYDPKLAPVGTELSVELTPSDGATKVVLEVAGLLPNRGYAAHAHSEECGKNGDIAGGHYQHKAAPNPDKPDPEYNNPKNEIWLDLRTDAKGNGTSTANVPFAISDWERPKSVVVHAAKKTATGDMAGEAGDRIACLTIPHSH